MTDDVARLGLVVDSSQVTAATAALNALVPAAKGAASATTPLASAANAAAAAHRGMSSQAMAASHSIRSMIEQVALGVPPTQILSQQLAHLSYAASGPGGLTGAFRQAGGAILGLLSPATLVVGGIAGVAGAAYLMNSAWQKSAELFDNASRAIGATIGQLRALDAAANVKGISTDEFLKSSEKFAGNIYDAKAGMGSLASLLRANGGAATSFEDTLGKVADLVRNAANDQQRLQILQQAGLPATMAWVRLLSDGAQGVKDALAGHKDLNDQEQKLVDNAREFDEAWNRTWNNFENAGRKAFLGIKSGVSGLLDGYLQLYAKNHPNDANSQIANRFGEFGGAKNSALQTAMEKRARQLRGEPEVADPNITAHALSMEQPRLGMLGVMKPAKEGERRDSHSDRKAA